ncbi:hypothetical protein KIN20_010713 [Parelaphostrongylus tenuis]|uniref:Uncharacterized protein n=1 Tax=Parelaphostrongylus tenuis TaxID=148309 RepID=A0AAD5QLK5_PARTN|nr:hypothetical protein KIN20_010713 [Parelaphostrongylus tenuis]
MGTNRALHLNIKIPLMLSFIANESYRPSPVTERLMMEATKQGDGSVSSLTLSCNHTGTPLLGLLQICKKIPLYENSVTFIQVYENPKTATETTHAMFTDFGGDECEEMH